MSNETIRTFAQLNADLMKGQTLKDFTPAEQKLYLAELGVTNVTNGEVKQPKDGQITIPVTSAKGKTYDVRVYVTPNGQIHYQGLPGASQKWGQTETVAGLEFKLMNAEILSKFIDENESKLARMNADGKVYIGGKELVKQ